MPEWTMLPIDKIGYDPRYYPRVNGHEDWMTALRYKEALVTHPEKSDPKNPGAFPPIVVVKAAGFDWPYILLDGLHRLRAFHQAGMEKIAATIERLPKSKWLERSVELNIDSKRPLDSGDKRWVAKLLMEEEGWTADRVATLLEMETGSFERLMSVGVHKLTAKSAKLISKGRSNREINGRHYGFLKAPMVDASGAANAEKALLMQGSVTSHDARQIASSFVAMLESRCFDLTDSELLANLSRAKELLESTIGMVEAAA